MGLIPRSGRSPGGGRISPLQHSCLEKPVDRGVHRVTKSRTDGSDLARTHACMHHFLPPPQLSVRETIPAGLQLRAQGLSPSRSQSVSMESSLEEHPPSMLIPPAPRPGALF